MTNIAVDYSRDNLLDKLGTKRMEESYFRDGEKSPQQRFAYVAKTFGSNPDHAQRLYDYASKHWLSFSTPILSYGRNERGLGISCFLNYIEDTAVGLVENLSETNWLSMLGGGVGIYFGIRPTDTKSSGVMAHAKTYDSGSMAYKQGSTRRGSYALYLDLSHPEILQFLEMRKPTGDPNLRTLNLHHAINVPDSFMAKIENLMVNPDADDSWDLINPHDGNVVKTISAKDLWQKILELRIQTGEPYIHFIDRSNEHLPQYLKDKGLKVNQSNLCSEIILPTNSDRTAVCCLSSLNLEYFDEWKDDDLFIRDTAEMLDNVLTNFIEVAPKEIGRAVYSASQERSIGIGALGFHAYLQKNMIPFESPLAKSVNMKIFSHIEERVSAANLVLGSERGEAPDAKGTGKRFSLSMAIAPNASSSLIMGNTSPSIEPFRANAYRQDTLSGAYLNKNKFLEKIMNEKFGPETAKKLWSSIISNDGSIQHLTEEFSGIEREVFKTAIEIDQRWIVEHAADRQPYIDQAQSLNLFFRPTTSVLYLHAVHFLAWKHGLKTLYYCRSEKVGRSDKLAQSIEREIIEEIDVASLVEEDSCLACEG